MADTDSRLLGGRYEVRSLIGRGGMAQVHLGRDTRLSRLVAIKILRVDLARDSVFQTRFRREAQAAASLNHPNIVAVYDTGEEAVRGADGKTISVPYIVMEYVEGHTVKDLLGDETPVPIPEAVEITTGVLSALEYAHAAGLVHRDIKPGNVMLTNSGKVKVMDFGIARALADSQATMTQTNAVIGTAQYLSPEQARGEVVDERSDLYSAGCLLFELLTGKAPFHGDSAVSLAYQHVSETPPLPSSIAADIPAELDRVTMKALAKNPDDRYSSAAEMQVDLVRAAEGLPIMAPPIAAYPATGVTEAFNQTAVTQAMGSATQTMQYPGSPDTDTTTTGTIPGQPPQKKKKGLTFVVWLLVIVAIAMVAGAIYYFVKESQPPEPELTLVPDQLVGMTQQEARSAIETAGLVFALSPEEMTSDDIEVGLVADTDPDSGEEVEVGSTVTVWISSGSAQETVPEMVGMSRTEVERQLTDLGFRVGEVREENSTTVPEGRLTRSSPGAGAVEPRGRAINLWFSTGLVEVPGNLINTSQGEAEAYLRDLNLNPVITTEENSSLSAGYVIRLEPRGGTMVPQGSNVTVVVSSGAPTPTPQPEPEPEQPQS